MNQEARRQILEDLGLVPWQLRVAPVTAGEPARGRAGRTGTQPESGGPPVPASRAPAPTRDAPPAADSPPVPATSTPSVPEHRTSRPAARPRPPAPAWAALSLAVPGVVMLVDGAASRRDLRLALDVLAAAAGDWHGKPVSRRLDWPPPVAAGAVATDEEAGGRALAAFAGKDVADHAARLLVCVASLARRLPQGEPDCRRVVVPDLEELGREPAAKRDLWRELAGGPA